MERESVKRLTAEWLRYDAVNYAMQQNFVPVVRKLVLRNDSERDLQQVTVRLKAEPAFASVWSRTADVVPAGRTLDMGPVHLELNGTFLAELTERLAGQLKLEVSQAEEIIYEESAPLAVLAYDQWGGLVAMPEMAAAFITPNHPAVASIIVEAAPLLGQWSGNPSFDAYQSRNPNRIRQQAAAIFAAIQARQIVYCVEPASFEMTGQRVRLPDAVVGTRMGNCLDLTLLYVACLEAVGLHPLVIFTKGHAFPGVWLVEETFAETVQDDVTLLTKRLAAGVHEISVAEATLACAGSHAAYREAEQTAGAHLADPDAFICFIDVKRARASAIRPLPLRVPTAQGWEIVREREVNRADAEAPDEVIIHTRPIEVVDAIPMTKQKQWERNLLDLTLRNSLLNFRLAKSALPLLGIRLGELEDALAEGQEFQLLPRPADWDNTPRSADLFQSVSKDDPLAVLVHQEFLNKRLRVEANDKELADKATRLYRSARTSLEENGANTLYLALGLLKWYESAASEQPRYAPLILIPVELIRKSSRTGFMLRIRDEEPQINITLLEMLRQDFGCQIGGLDPLPRDDKGIDLAGIFTVIRHAIMTMPRWDIIESAFVGLFSFSRFVMWNDIRNRADDLAGSKVVSSLMSGRLQWEPEALFPDPARLDELYAPDRLLLPISADSSQITAVSAANGGHSFVLHGPPGTGKSQTITNMIASALADGKTVLFVAEKMAALSVVQSRLAQIGLGAFCLELHSNKSTKKAVLDQLRQTLEAVRTASPEAWAREAERLAAAKSELNGYVASLHRKYRFGASLYEAVTRYGSVKSAPDIAPFDPAAVGAMSQDQYIAWSDCANELRVAGEAAGGPAGNAWADAACTAYTPSLRSQAEVTLAAYAAKLTETQRFCGELSRLLGDLAAEPNREALARLGDVAELLLAAPAEVPAALLGAADLAAASERVAAAARHGARRDELRARIAARFTAEALGYDAAAALAEWRKAERQWFLPKLLKTNRICKSLKALAVGGSGLPLQKNETPETLALIMQYQAEADELKQAEPAVSAALGALWRGGEADWKAVDAANDWIARLQQALLRLARDGGAAVRFRERLAGLMAGGREIFMERHGRSLADFGAATRELAQLEDQLSDMLKIDFSAMDERRGEQPWFDFRERRALQWRESVETLREWCSWRQVRDRAEAAGLNSLVAAYESGQLQSAEVCPAFERSWWRAVIDYILAEDPQLASFSGRLFEEKIRGFREMAERFEKLTRQEIAARLAASIPPLVNQASSNSEAGILLRAIRSGGRGMSLRRLFEQIPNLLSRICPCVLMSPMSVAQYLDPKYALFDLVVFDEASQLPTSEAIGAMARGRNVVVVGDPKQLPPTSFFTSTTGEDADDAVVPEDLESILDDCLALGMPQAHLLWHYRSRHESLIAFSNRHFYENKLLTFPSPHERKSSVRWHPVDGFYDRGKTKHNRAEAQAVVEEISRRLRDERESQRSIGVVTFNSVQQTLIEDLLDEAFRKDGELELLASRLYEPIFVKNLENVQGDERDVILFSIGYGPDATGKVVLNFGPLNRDGGWRRLNVAVSRARHEMHVFSTLRAEHLDASRTRAEGVGVLRSFLEYAERGRSALGVEADRAAVEHAGIESQIADALEREGYKIDLHVGASGFRMDLAVVNPDRPDSYLLAVLCDGERYRTGHTARDREVLREQVLRQLGWRLHRVWSLDWLDNPSRELRRVVEAIEAARAAAETDEMVRAERAAGATGSAERAAGATGSAERAVGATGSAERAVGATGSAERAVGAAGSAVDADREAAMTATISGTAAADVDSVHDSAEDGGESVIDGEPVSSASGLGETDAPMRQAAEHGNGASAWRRTYVSADLSAAALPPEEFYAPNHSRTVMSQIGTVVQTEGPISKPLLIRRVLHAWGMARSGPRIERHFDQLLAVMKLRTTNWDGTDFYWPDELEPDAYVTYRVAEGEQERRNAEDLPPEEIANAIKEVLFTQISLPIEDLIRETVRLLGYSRTGAALDKAVRNGIREAERRGTADLDNGRATYRKTAL